MKRLEDSGALILMRDSHRATLNAFEEDCEQHTKDLDDAINEDQECDSDKSSKKEEANEDVMS